jgi:hypothetical protein
MTRKPKPKLTDAERHKRFVEMAHEVEASEDPKDFERAFKKVARPYDERRADRVPENDSSKPRRKK